MQVIRIFNEFLWIENVFKIDCGNQKIEKEAFNLKDIFFYSVDLLLSLKQECKVMIFMDPWMPEDVEGDLLKFRQILTSILNFAFKCSNNINLQTSAHLGTESSGFTIYFSVAFKPKLIDLKVDSLRLLFSNDGLSLSNQTNMNNHVGLSIHLVSNLINLMGGKFTEIEERRDGEIFIMFTLPFDPIEKSNSKYINKTDIRLHSSRSYENGSVVLKSPEVNSKVMVLKYNQESGDEVAEGALNKYTSSLAIQSNKPESKSEIGSNVPVIKDQNSVRKVRNSIRSMERPKELEQNKQSEAEKSQKDDSEKVREDLNSTIMNYKNKPKKFTVKPEPKAEVESDALSFVGYQYLGSRSNDSSANPKMGAFSGLSAQNNNTEQDLNASTNPNKIEKDVKDSSQQPKINVDELSNNSGGGLIGRIKEEQTKQEKNLERTNKETQKASEVKEDAKIEQVGSRFSFEGMIS